MASQAGALHAVRVYALVEKRPGSMMYSRAPKFKRAASWHGNNQWIDRPDPLFHFGAGPCSRESPTIIVCQKLSSRLPYSHARVGRHAGLLFRWRIGATLHTKVCQAREAYTTHHDVVPTVKTQHNSACLELRGTLTFLAKRGRAIYSKSTGDRIEYP